MKNWKKYMALLAALLLVLSFTACTTPAEEDPTDPPVEQTQAPTEEVTEAPTEEILEAPTRPAVEYTIFKGEWHSGDVTLNVKEEERWVMSEDGEVFITGTLTVNEDGDLVLYDVEGVEAAKMILDAEGSIYAEMYVEEMYNRIDDFTFTREKSNYVDMDEMLGEGMEENFIDVPVDEQPAVPEDPAE